MDIRVGAATNVGKVRDHNEDSFCVNRKHKVFIVADGMGGHAAGEIASNQLKDYIEEYLLRDDRDDSIHTCLIDGIQAANKAIYQMGIQDAAKRGMGTTATILTVDDAKYYIAQVGDSRCYRLRDGEFEQLTRDHSRVFQLYESGLITKDEIEDHPLSNVITRSIGNHATVDPDVYEGEFQVGDRYLLCSDGLTGEVRDAQIKAILETHKDPQEAVEILIEAALNNGGKDNVTIVVLDFKEGEDARRKTVPMTLEQLKNLPPPPGAVDRTDGWSGSKPPAEGDAAEGEPPEEVAEPPAADAPDAEDAGTPSTEPPARKPAPPRSLDTPVPLPGDELSEDELLGGLDPRPGPGPNLGLYAVVLLVLGALGMYLSAGEVEAGLSVSSSPDRAEVYIDARFRGTTPLLLPELAPGKYELEVRLAGHESRKLALEVGPEGRTTKHLILEKAKGP